MGIGNLFHLSVEVNLFSPTVVGDLSYYPHSMPIFSTMDIDATSINF
jgi:hypothetical protein